MYPYDIQSIRLENRCATVVVTGHVFIGGNPWIGTTPAELRLSGIHTHHPRNSGYLVGIVVARAVDPITYDAEFFARPVPAPELRVVRQPQIFLQLEKDGLITLASQIADASGPARWLAHLRA